MITTVIVPKIGSIAYAANAAYTAYNQLQNYDDISTKQPLGNYIDNSIGSEIDTAYIKYRYDKDGTKEQYLSAASVLAPFYHTTSELIQINEPYITITAKFTDKDIHDTTTILDKKASIDPRSTDWMQNIHTGQYGDNQGEPVTDTPIVYNKEEYEFKLNVPEITNAGFDIKNFSSAADKTSDIYKYSIPFNNSSFPERTKVKFKFENNWQAGVITDINGDGTYNIEDIVNKKKDIVNKKKDIVNKKDIQLLNPIIEINPILVNNVEECYKKDARGSLNVHTEDLPIAAIVSHAGHAYIYCFVNGIRFTFGFGGNEGLDENGFRIDLRLREFNLIMGSTRGKLYSNDPLVYDEQYKARTVISWIGYCDINVINNLNKMISSGDLVVVTNNNNIINDITVNTSNSAYQLFNNNCTTFVQNIFNITLPTQLTPMVQEFIPTNLQTINPDLITEFTNNARNSTIAPSIKSEEQMYIIQKIQASIRDDGRAIQSHLFTKDYKKRKRGGKRTKAKSRKNKAKSKTLRKRK
jgi:hypothetical protein